MTELRPFSSLTFDLLSWHIRQNSRDLQWKTLPGAEDMLRMSRTCHRLRPPLRSDWASAAACCAQSAAVECSPRTENPVMSFRIHRHCLQKWARLLTDIVSLHQNWIRFHSILPRLPPVAPLWSDCSAWSVNDCLVWQRQSCKMTPTSANY